MAWNADQRCGHVAQAEDLGRPNRCAKIAVEAVCSARKRRNLSSGKAALVEIAADHDAAGIKAAHELARHLKLEERRVWIAVPHMAGRDFNDHLNLNEGL